MAFRSFSMHRADWSSGVHRADLPAGETDYSKQLKVIRSSRPEQSFSSAMS